MTQRCGRLPHPDRKRRCALATENVMPSHAGRRTVGGSPLCVDRRMLAAPKAGVASRRHRSWHCCRLPEARRGRLPICRARPPVRSGRRTACRSLSCATPIRMTSRRRRKTRVANQNTRAIYRFNGAGYTDPTRNQHIWIIDVPGSSDGKSTPKQLTSGNFDEQEPSFTPDGKTILYHTNRDPEPYYNLPKSEIMSIPVSGGTPQLL